MTENSSTAAAQPGFDSMWQSRLKSLIGELRDLLDADTNHAKVPTVREIAEFASELPVVLASAMVEDGLQHLDDALRITGAPRDEVEASLDTAREMQRQSVLEEVEGFDADEIHELWTEAVQGAADIIMKHGPVESMGPFERSNYEHLVRIAQVYADVHDAAKAAEA